MSESQQYVLDELDLLIKSDTRCLRSSDTDSITDSNFLLIQSNLSEITVILNISILMWYIGIRLQQLSIPK